MQTWKKKFFQIPPQTQRKTEKFGPGLKVIGFILDETLQSGKFESPDFKHDNNL